MQDTLMFVIKNIVTVPDEVKIEESLDETGTTTYLVSVNPSDVGRIIGKEGKVIKAIRTIMRVIAIQKGVHVRVSVASETEGGPNSDTSAPTTQETPDPVTASADDSLSVEV